jgi:hypothetical protein
LYFSKKKSLPKLLSLIRRVKYQSPNAWQKKVLQLHMTQPTTWKIEILIDGKKSETLFEFLYKRLNLTHPWGSNGGKIEVLP